MTLTGTRCPGCERDDWIVGKLIGGHRGEKVRFKAANAKFLLFSYPEVSARVCRNCGHVSLSASVEAIRKTLKD